MIVDLPFPTNHLGVHRAIENAGRILKEVQARLADAVATFSGGRLQDDATLIVLAADQG